MSSILVYLVCSLPYHRPVSHCPEFCAYKVLSGHADGSSISCYVNNVEPWSFLVSLSVCMRLQYGDVPCAHDIATEGLHSKFFKFTVLSLFNILPPGWTQSRINDASEPWSSSIEVDVSGTSAWVVHLSIPSWRVYPGRWSSPCRRPRKASHAHILFVSIIANHPTA